MDNLKSGEFVCNTKVLKINVQYKANYQNRSMSDPINIIPYLVISGRKKTENQQVK